MIELAGNDNPNTDVILGWYHDMHVDHLLEDELLFELSIRQIMISDDPSFSRRRRSLREHLKAEREENRLLLIEIIINFEQEFATIEQKLNDILNHMVNGDKFVKAKCKSRLLHLGHKLYQLISNTQESEHRKQFNLLLVKCTRNLDNYFYSIPSGTNQDPIPDNSLTKKDSGKQSTNNILQLESSILDKITAMQERINELERQIANKSSCRDSCTQTPNEQQVNQVPNNNANYLPLDNLPFLGHNLNTSTVYSHTVSCHHNPISSSYDQPSIISRSIPSQTAPLTSVANRVPSHCWPDHLQTPHPICSHSYYGLEPTRRTNILPNFSTCYQNPFDSIPRFSSNPVPNFVQTPSHLTPPTNQSRRSLPVSKWSIIKYNGEDQGLKLNEFLEFIQALALAEQTSEVELFESAVHLFSGAALKWYMTMRSSGLLLNWQHLVWELKRNFMHPDLDALIKKKIYRRSQNNKESFHEFYYEMEKLFRTMSVQLSEYEKLKILEQNMRLEYKKQLAFVNISDLPSLISAAKKVDALLYPAYQKVFEDEKSIHLVEAKHETKNKNKPQSNTVSSATQPNSSKNLPQNAQNQSKRQSQNNPTACTSGLNRLPVTLEELINSHRPPSSSQCYNCGNYGHQLNNCRMPRGVICENCGFRGYPTNNCPYCIKNSLPVSENRRPLNFSH